MEGLKRVAFSKLFACLPESWVKRPQPMMQIIIYQAWFQVPAVVDGGEEVVEEMVAEGGEDEQEAALVQVSYCVQLKMG